MSANLSPRIALALLAIVTLLASVAFAQTTISTGSIQGTVTDQSGAVVSDAKVTITDKATGRVVNATTGSSGTYTSGALTPGDYTVRVEAQGFKTVEQTVTAQVGVTTSGNIKMQLGQATQVVQVEGSTLEVNTEQATVQGVLTQEQIENLPVNGRNFLDLAQLEPGVQIQDGGDVDPTKKGFAAISFGGRFGRTARIEVDGVDTSDETVGTTTQDIPQGAIQEFQIGESMLDLSTELTSSGSVNVVTKSGSNTYHGSGFYAFRDQSLNADLPGGSDTYFQRNQYGGNFGGAIIKDKLFFFGDIERTQQAFQIPVQPGPPFNVAADQGAYSAPFRETEGIGRVDWQISKSYHMFYRFSDNKNSDFDSFEGTAYQPLDNTNRTHDHVVGLDFSTGSFTHSIRFGYMKFFNHIASGTTANTPFNYGPIELALGPDAVCLNTSGAVPDDFCSGQGFLAPQTTPQSDHQIKYDGSKIWGKHIIRYGGGFNHIQGGGFAGFLADGPAVNDSSTDCPSNPLCGTLPGGGTNPLNFLTNTVLLGNGQGFETEHPAFGFPGGGLGPDNRFSWYVGDSWKIKSNFTLDVGLRYVRDTGRSDSDLAAIPQLSTLFDNQFYSGLGNRVNNPNKNFAPQLGIAYDPWRNGKTVFRGGVGLFYENSIWNNVLFDRPARLPTGSFLGIQPSCAGGGAIPYDLPGTTTLITPTYCNQPIGSVISDVVAAQAQYQAAAATVGAGTNDLYILNSLADTGPNGTGTNLFYPGYKTARSVQINLGVQHEIRRGMVYTADYLRNVSTHTLLAVDTNHVGDARFLNTTAATAAINETLADCGVGTIDLAIASCPGLHPGGGGATIVDFASHPAPVPGATPNLLDSGYEACAGAPCPNAAFGGINNGATGGNQMLFPIGRSTYNGLQMSLKQDIHNPFKGVPYMNLQVSYALSRYRAMAADTDFINSAWDAADTGKYMGPNGLDRTNQLSFGGVFQFPFHIQANIIGHFYSELPSTLFLPSTGAPGGMFVTGANGDGQGDGYAANGSNGTLGSILPGQNLGSFDRGVNASNINGVINNYNQKYAGQPTPSGQALVAAGLFSSSQLTQLGAVMPVLPTAPAGEADNGWLKDLDMNLAWTYKIAERFELTPGVSFFNVFNFANFDGPKNTLSGILNGASGTVNGTSGTQPVNYRIGLGSGVFGVGAPRVTEFSLKFSF
jgi:Carboxypeptidase regulatory-like domain